MPSVTRMMSCRAVAAAMMIAAGLAASVHGQDAAGNVFANGIRLQDEIALVNSRPLCGSCDGEALRNGLGFENYAVCNEAGGRSWQRSDLESFLAFDPAVRTIIFIHGNQISAGDAKVEGLAIYRRLVRYAGDSERIRFVIWSWPSAQIGGLLRDVRVKAARTGPAACQLAWLLDQMQPETPVSLVGFSFGARIITGALHILGGGSLGSCALVERAHPDRAPVNVVLIAAALHAHWLGDGQHHGLAMSQVNQMFLVNSCQDVAMRYYRFVTKYGRPQALGLRGPTRLSADGSGKIQMIDVGRYTGSEHNMFRYLCAPGVVAQTWENSASAPANGLVTIQ